jgi:PAS domain S-box-containing protein
MSQSAGLADLETIFRELPVGLCILDRSLRVVHSTARYAEIIGRKGQDLVGRSLGDVLAEPARERGIWIANRVIETGEPFRGAERRELGRRHPKERIWRVSVYPLRREGLVTGLMALVLDITDVRLAEEEASAAFREIESIYRNAPVGLSFVDRNLCYLRVNQAIADMNGRTIEEVVGRTYRDMSPETADTAEPFLRGLMQRGESVRNMEVQARPPADPTTDHTYLLSLDCVRDPSGEVIGHTSVVQDVTDLRNAQEAAARRLEELELVYEHTPVGLCHMDSDLRLVHLNPRFGELCERPPAERIGAHASTLFPERISRQLVPQLSFVARSGRSSVGLEVRGQIPGQTRERTWIAETHPTKSRDGAITGILTVVQDVTPFAERRRDAEATRDRLAEAQQVARLGSFEWDLLDDRVWWSRELYEIFGAPASRAPSYEGFYEYVHPEDRSKVRSQVERILETDQASQVTYRIQRFDGAERVVFGIARLERTASGKPARMIGTVQDVTEFSPSP